MLVPIEVFDRVGSVDARRLPHYAADYEFAMRAARAGFRLALSYKAVVRVNTEITGSEGDLATPVGLREALFLLFSRRSIRNVWHRLQFVSLACPPQFRLRNYLAVLAASAWLITNVPIAFQTKNFLLRMVLAERLKNWMRDRKLIP
jgi:GT2 family glycosyltransferase